MSRQLKIGAAQYPLSYHNSWHDYAQKIQDWVVNGVQKGANLLLFPEYSGMEMVSLVPSFEVLTLSEQLVSIQSFVKQYLNLYSSLARKYDIHILAGSFPFLKSKKYVNTAWFFYPDGKIAAQEKNIITPFERKSNISSGKGAKVFDCAFGKIGVAICYDSEFPLFIRKQCESGAEIILVPSCTDSMSGYSRVRIACQSRALENQCFVIQASTVSVFNGCEIIDKNIGIAGAFGPPDTDFPEDGIIALGSFDMSGWICADIDLDLVAKVRASGQVQNFNDWS